MSDSSWCACLLLASMVSTTNAADLVDRPGAMTIAFNDLHKNVKGKKVNVDSSEACGLSLHTADQPGRYDSDSVQLALLADIVQTVWTSTIPRANLRVRVAASRDKRH